MNLDLKICFNVWAFMALLVDVSLFGIEASFSISETKIEVTDSFGQELMFTEPLQRVVSLDSGIVEIFFELGKESRLVGRSRFADFPDGVHKITNVGGLVDPNFEIIVGLSPDLVFVSRMGLTEGFLERFEALGIPTILLDMETADELLIHASLIGHLLGASSSAEELIESWKGELAALDTRAQQINDKVPKRLKGLLLYGIHGYYSAGQETWVGSLFQRAGVGNLAAGRVSAWPTLSAEGIIAEAPDFIVVASWTPDSFREATDFFKNMNAKPSGVWSALGIDLTNSVTVADPGLFIVNGPRIIDSYKTLIDALDKKLNTDI